MQKLLITLGLGIASVGVLYPYLNQTGLGQLPGDIILKGENSTFYFPVDSCIAISLIVSILLSRGRSNKWRITLLLQQFHSKDGLRSQHQSSTYLRRPPQAIHRHRRSSLSFEK